MARTLKGRTSNELQYCLRSELDHVVQWLKVDLEFFGGVLAEMCDFRHFPTLRLD